LQGKLEVAVACDEGRVAAADSERVVISPAEKVGRPVIVHDAKAQDVEAIDDTLLLAYLIEPSRPEYPLEDLEGEYGLELDADPATDEETTALVRNAAATYRLRNLLLERVRERGMEPLYRNVELPLSPVLAAMERAGVKIDEYRMGEITARLREMVEELESRAYELAGEEFMLGSTQQVGRILFEKLGLTPGRKGKTGYSTDTRVLRSIRDEHPIVAVIEEWREYSKLVNTYLGPLPTLIDERDGRLHTTFNQTVAATAWLKCVCSRPSSPISVGSGPRYVSTSFVSSRQSSITSTIACSCLIVRRTRVSVE
jgi:DNA polymerase-1